MTDFATIDDSAPDLPDYPDAIWQPDIQASSLSAFHDKYVDKLKIVAIDGITLFTSRDIGVKIISTRELSGSKIEAVVQGPDEKIGLRVPSDTAIKINVYP